MTWSSMSANRCHVSITRSNDMIQHVSKQMSRFDHAVKWHDPACQQTDVTFRSRGQMTWSSMSANRCHVSITRSNDMIQHVSKQMSRFDHAVKWHDPACQQTDVTFRSRGQMTWCMSGKQMSRSMLCHTFVHRLHDGKASVGNRRRGMDDTSDEETAALIAWLSCRQDRNLCEPVRPSGKVLAEGPRFDTNSAFLSLQKDCGLIVDTVLWLSITSYWNIKMALIAAQITQGSFWWWQCGNRYVISPFPHLHNPFLISLMVSVDVKHHVYIERLCRINTQGS